MTGIEMLEQAREHAPDAKFLLLTAYADTDVAIKAINDIGLDYYLLKPWDPPAERLYPVVDDLLGDWQRAHPQDTGDVRVVGHRWSERSHEVKTFLARNHVPYRWLDVDRDEEARAAPGARATPQIDDLPLVLVPDGEVAPVAVHARPRRRARPAHPRRAAALRPVHRRRRPGRAGRRGLRRVRGPAHRRGRARGARRPGRPERVDRELPRLPEGPVRCRPHAPRRRPGRALRRRDGAGPRRRGVRDARAGARGALRRRRRARGAGGARRDRGLVPPARGAGPRGAHRSRRLLRRDRERGDPVPGRRGVRRRRRQLGRPGGAQPGPLREAGRAGRARRRARGHHVALPRRADPGRAEHRGAAPQRGRRRPAATATSRRSRSPTATRAREEEVPTSWLFVFIGASPRTDWLGADVVRDDEGLRHHRARTCSPPRTPRRGRWPGHRSRWRPACPACSPPATCGSTR